MWPRLDARNRQVAAIQKSKHSGLNHTRKIEFLVQNRRLDWSLIGILLYLHINEVCNMLLRGQNKYLGLFTAVEWRVLNEPSFTWIHPEAANLFPL